MKQVYKIKTKVLSDLKSHSQQLLWIIIFNVNKGELKSVSLEIKELQMKPWVTFLPIKTGFKNKQPNKIQC